MTKALQDVERRRNRRSKTCPTLLGTNSKTLQDEDSDHEHPCSEPEEIPVRRKSKDILCQDVEASRVRACSIYDVVTGMGRALGDNSVVTAEAHERVSRPQVRLDAFLSHSWQQGRFQKYMQLIFVFNLPAAAAAARAAAVVGMLLSATGVLQVISLPCPEGYASRCMGFVAFYATVFFWGDFKQMCRVGRMPFVFFDKFCINQQDLAEKAEGIKALGATVLASERMVVLYSSSYFSRLWTVFEVACFMSVHDLRQLTLVPEFMPRAVLSAFFVFTCSSFLQTSVLYNHHGTLSTDRGESSDSALWGEAAVLFLNARIFFAATVQMLCVLLFQRGRALEMSVIQKKLQDFRIQDASCFDERDRPLVYRHVADLERSLVTKIAKKGAKHALESFNSRVRLELRRSMQSALPRHGLPYRAMICATTPMFCGACDVLGAGLADATPPRLVFTNVMLRLQNSFLTFPLFVSFGADLMKCCLRLHDLWGVESLFVLSCTIAMTSVMVVGLYSSFVLARLAVQSELALCVWIVMIVSQIVAIQRAFKSTSD